MSFDIYVLVPARSWPTARQLDDALVAAGHPVRLGIRSQAAWAAPLAPVAAEPFRFVVQNDDQARAFGQPVGATVEVPHETAMSVTLDGVTLDPDFGMETLTDPDELNADLGRLQGGPTAATGDHLVWFSHHSNQFNYNAAIYVLAVLISDFDGYGYEWQGMSHGRAGFVEELLGSLYPSPVDVP